MIPAVEIESVEVLDHHCKLVVKAVDKYLDSYQQKVNHLSIKLSDHHSLTHQLGLEPCTEISRRGVILCGVHDEA